MDNFGLTRQVKLIDKLRLVGLEFEGRPHCGRDDARNIARLALALKRRGVVLSRNAGVGPAEPDKLTSLCPPQQANGPALLAARPPPSPRPSPLEASVPSPQARVAFAALARAVGSTPEALILLERPALAPLKAFCKGG